MNWSEEKQFLAKNEYLDEILSWSNARIDALLKVRKAQLRMRLAVEEAVVNVVRYAYEHSTKEPVLVIKIAQEGDCLYYQLEDQGVAFNPLENIVANPNLKLIERTVGGWGRAIMVSFTDSSSYCNKDGWNILTLVKKDIAPALINKKRVLEKQQNSGENGNG